MLTVSLLAPKTHLDFVIDNKRAASPVIKFVKGSS